MSWFARLFSTPERQLEIAAEAFRAGNDARARKAADVAISMLQPRFPGGDDKSKELLGRAWFLKGRLEIKAGNRSQALRCFFACPDHVARDRSHLAFVVNEAVKLSEVPTQLYPLFVEFMGNADLRRSDPSYQRSTARIRKILRPDPGKAGSVEAVESWNTALSEKVNDCAWPHYHLAIIAAWRSNWNAAIVRVKKALALEAQNEAARRLYAFALMQQAPANALAVLKQAGGLGSSRATLILRAHLEMQAGDMGIALQCYRKADGMRQLEGEQVIAFAEALVRCGDAAEARRVLGRVQGKISLPARIVQTLALLDKRPVGEVLDPLVNLLGDGKVKEQAAAAILAVVAKHPGHDGALTALERIPTAQRTEQYHLIEGVCHAAQRHWSAALSAWSHQRRLPVGFDKAKDAIRINELVDRYNAGDFLGVLEARAPHGELPADLAAEADRLCTSALGRLWSQASQKQLDQLALGRLADAVSAIPGIAERPESSTVVGAILTACGKHERALDLMRKADGVDAALIGATAALCLGRPKVAIELLDRDPSVDPRKVRLRAIASAQLGDWDRALAALGSDPSPLYVAISYLAGRFAEVEAAPVSGGAASYFKAVCLLRARKRDAAKAELERLAADAPMRVEADRLIGWLALADAAAAYRQGNITTAQTALIDAARHWPGTDGALAALPAGEEGLLAALVYTNDRSKLREALLNGSRLAGFGDPKSCHRLAIFHMAEGHARAGRAQHKTAIAEWETAIGYLAVVLQSRDYMDAWRSARVRAYNFALPDDANIETSVREFCGKLFDEAAAGMDAKNAAAARLLGLSLEAELRAAELLAQYGGFEHDGRRVVFGPTALAATELAGEFAEYCLDLGVDEGSAVLEEVEQFFSSLRHAAAWLRRGDFDHTLEQIERLGAHCFPLCHMDRCEKGPLEGCPGRGKRFVACNPAFARDMGMEDLKLAAVGMQLTVVLKIAEREIANKEPKLDRLKALWGQAAKLGKLCARADEVEQKINSLVTGRVQVISEANGADFTHRLVEEANAICPTADLQNELALLTTTRAVSKVNDHGDYATAADMLRKAYALSPHQPRVKKNLIIVLRGSADEKFKKDNAACFALLQEAYEAGTRWLSEDRFNPEIATTVTDTECEIMQRHRVLAIDTVETNKVQTGRHLRDAVEFGLKCLRRGDIGNQTREMIISVAGDLAILLAGMGVERFNRSVETDKAADLLRAARMLDPATASITRNLIVVLHGVAVAKVEASRHQYSYQSNQFAESIELMEEAQLTGRAWLNRGEDREIRDLVVKIGADIEILSRGVSSYGRSSKWHNSSTVMALMDPSMDDGLALLRNKSLI